MARYRRNNSGGIIEAIFGLFMVFLAMTIINPKLREQLVSTVQTIFAVLFFCAFIGLLYFLYRQIKNNNEVDLLPTRNARPRTYDPNSSPYSSPPKDGISQSDVTNNNDYTAPALQFADLPIIEPIEWDETILNSIEWKRFEVVCKEFFRMTGFDPRETNIGADGGVDIRIYKVGSEMPDKPDAIVQCKAWNTYKVGVKLVRELFGIMAAEKVERGMIITSGEFTNDAKEFAEGKKVSLISGNSFLQRIRNLPEEKQQHLLDVALEGDYMIPTCPQCDIKMTLREGKSGGKAGSKFWGCVRYPRCRQTLVYKGQQKKVQPAPGPA